MRGLMIVVLFLSVGEGDTQHTLAGRAPETTRRDPRIGPMQGIHSSIWGRAGGYFLGVPGYPLEVVVKGNQGKPTRFREVPAIKPPIYCREVTNIWATGGPGCAVSVRR